MSQPPPALSPDGKYWWDGQGWQPMPGTVAELKSASISSLQAERSFGFLGGCTVKIANGYIEVKGAPMNARARVPIEAVEYAVVQRSTMGTPVTGQPQLVLVGRGAELGHADLPLGKRNAGEQAAEWINEVLRQHRG